MFSSSQDVKVYSLLSHNRFLKAQYNQRNNPIEIRAWGTKAGITAVGCITGLPQ